MRKFWVCKTPIDKYLGQEALALQNKNCQGHSLPPAPTCWCQQYHKRHYRRHQRHQSEKLYALRWLKNYLRSTMKLDNYNNCLLLRCHRSIADTLDTVKIAEVCLCQQIMQRAFWEIWDGVCTWLSERCPSLHLPYISKCSTASELRKVFENIPGHRNEL